MTARALRTLGQLSTAAPLRQPRIQRRPQATTISRPISTTTTMHPKIAANQDERKVKAELEELVETGWQLDNEEIQLEKTYHLSSYRNVKVSKTAYVLNKNNKY